MSVDAGGLCDLHALTPEEFRVQLASKGSTQPYTETNSVEDEHTAAYEAFLNNCRALSVKANTALVQRADNIRHGSLVDLSRTYVGGVGLQAMCPLLAKNRTLRTLLLPQNGLYNDAVVYFCRSMKYHPTLTTVDFSGNPLVSLAGGLALLSLINDNRPILTEVNITGTRIPGAVLQKIQRAVAANQEAWMTVSSGASRHGVPTLPVAADAVAPMAKTTGGPSQSPQKTTKTEDASVVRTADGHTAARLYQTYTRGCDPTNMTGRVAADSRPETRSSQKSAAHVGDMPSDVNQEDASPRPLTTDNTSQMSLNSAGVVAPHTRAEREAARAAAWLEKERAALARLQHRLAGHAALLRANHATNTLPPADAITRWRVLEVAILAPPAIFDSEIGLLLDDVFPALNKVLQPYRLTLLPLVNPPSSVTASAAQESSVTATTSTVASTFPVGAAGHVLKTLQCTCGVDLLQDVQRSRLAVIELIGDRPGDLRQPCEADMEAGATDMLPVLYHAHQEALACSHCIIAAIRCGTARMAVPPALAPLFTCEPRIEHPDKHRAVTKTLRLEADDEAAVVAHTTASSVHSTVRPREDPVVVLQHEDEVHLWERHEAFKAHVRRSLQASPELLIDGYKATFECTDSSGALRVGDLGEFRNAVYDRLHVMLTTLFSPVTTMDLLSVVDLGITDPQASRGAGMPTLLSTPSSSDADAVHKLVLPERDLFTGPAAHQRHLTERAGQTVTDRVFGQRVEASPRTLPRKGVHNRLHLYVTTPPSRNVFLLHHPYESTTLTSTLAISATKQLFGKPFAYTVATHTTRAGMLCEEPTDVRAVMVHILSQLTTHPDVLRYLRCEVDVHRLKRFFINFLSGSQLRSVDTQPAMAALSALGSGAAPTATVSTQKTTPVTASTTARGGTMAVPMPEITAKILQQMAKEAGGEEKPRGHLHHGSVTPARATASVSAEDANKVFVVLLDGLDEVTAPITPCAALRRSPETGADEWSVGATDSPSAAANEDSAPSHRHTTNTSGKVKNAQLVAEETERLSFLPTCLSRNVRLIATCTTDPAPQLLKVMSARGRDSVDTFAIANTTINETEMLLSPSVLEAFGAAVSDDGLVLARDKKDSQNPEFLHYLIDALRMHAEAPGTHSLLTLLTAFPETVDGAAQRVHQQLIARFGKAFVKNALGLISVSRWGIVESDLRALLKLPPKQFNEFLRVLRPALETWEWFGVPPIPSERSVVGGSAGGAPDDDSQGVPAVVEESTSSGAAPASVHQTRLDPNCSGNALQRRVRLVSPAFLRLLHNEELHADEDGSASAAERRAWHQTLAQYYYAVAQRSLNQERHQLLLSMTPASAAERQAVKEFVYHAALGGLWALLDRLALSFPFMMLVYRHQLAYAFLRDLIFAFNTRHEAYLLGPDVLAFAQIDHSQGDQSQPVDQDDLAGDAGDLLSHDTNTQTAAATRINHSGSSATALSKTEFSLPTALLRMRSYIFFVRAYSASLTEYPHLLLQAALEGSPCLSQGADLGNAVNHHNNSIGDHSTLRMVQFEAADYVRRYFYWQPSARAVVSATSTGVAMTATGPSSDAQIRLQNRKRVFFRIVNERKSRVHLGAINACLYSTNGNYVVTGSNDRSIAWIQPESGSVLYQGRQITARVRQLIFADTSAYVLAVAEDRTLYVYDANLGKLVSRNDAALFDAPISTIQFSSRGRYYMVALEDLSTHVFSTERSQLLGSITASSWSVGASEAAAVGTAGDDAGRRPPMAHRRAHMHILADPVDEQRFHVLANEYIQTCRVNALGDDVEIVRPPQPTSLDTPLASVQWYTPAVAHASSSTSPAAQLHEMRVPAHEAARKALSSVGRFALVVPLSRSFVSLYDMEEHCETTRAYPPTLQGRRWQPTTARGGAAEDDALALTNDATSPTVVAFSAGHAQGRWLAVAGSDGSVGLYDMFACVPHAHASRQLSSSTASSLKPVEAPLHTCFSAFRASAVSPRILGLGFALCDTALVAVCASGRVMYWDIQHLASEEAAVPLSPVNVGADDHRPRLCDGADGEFLFNSVSRGRLVSWSLRASSSPSSVESGKAKGARTVEEGASLIALGDSDGRLVLLDLWRPTSW